MAAKTKRTKERKKKILDLLKAGLNRRRAFTAAGLGHTAFYEWLAEDEAFGQEVEEAEAEYLGVLEVTAHRLAKGGMKVTSEKINKYDPKTGALKETIEREAIKPPSESMVMFLLERRDPEQYGRKDTLKLDKVEKMTDDELLAESAAILARARGSEGAAPQGA